HLVCGVIIGHPGKEVVERVVVASFLGSENAIPRGRWLHRGIEDYAVGVLGVQRRIGRAQESAVAEPHHGQFFFPKSLTHHFPVTSSIFSGQRVGVARGSLFAGIANKRAHVDHGIDRAATHRGAVNRSLARQATRLYANKVPRLADWSKALTRTNPTLIFPAEGFE